MKHKYVKFKYDQCCVNAKLSEIDSKMTGIFSNGYGEGTSNTLAIPLAGKSISTAIKLNTKAAGLFSK